MIKKIKKNSRLQAPTLQISEARGAESLFSSQVSVTQSFHNIFISTTDCLHGGISVSVFVFIVAYCF